MPRVIIRFVDFGTLLVDPLHKTIYFECEFLKSLEFLSLVTLNELPIVNILRLVILIVSDSLNIRIMMFRNPDISQNRTNFQLIYSNKSVLVIYLLVRIVVEIYIRFIWSDTPTDSLIIVFLVVSISSGG